MGDNQHIAACLRRPHCPRCKYPCSPGGPYLGIYDPKRPCDDCGYVVGNSLKMPPPSPLSSLLGSLFRALTRR